MNELKELKPEKDFFIGVDSDGCVFDSMEIKQKECFCPNFIKSFELQRVQKYARETWEFVNLYSKYRGVNRFVAIVEAFRLLNDRPEVHARALVLPDTSPLEEWISQETRLGNPALEEYISKKAEPFLQTVLEWSYSVNASVAEMVQGLSPYPAVLESLKIMHEKADTMVVSQTPLEALKKEWKENGIDTRVRFIAGQEHGTKTEHIALAARGKYPEDKILMVGDAPGDYDAARLNGVLFYPIIPGLEEASWINFLDDALNRFFEGSYAGTYEKQLISDFHRHLPEKPPWELAEGC